MLDADPLADIKNIRAHPGADGQRAPSIAPGCPRRACCRAPRRPTSEALTDGAAGQASADCSSAVRSFTSTGLTRWASNPASVVNWRSRSWPQPVTATRKSGGPEVAARSRRGGVVAVEAGHPDVEQDRVRLEAAGDRSVAVLAVVDGAHVVAMSVAAASPELSAPSRLSSTTSTRPAAGDAGRRLGLALERRVAGGERHGETAAAPQPGALAADPTAVQIDQALHQGQADAQPALRPVRPSARPGRTSRTRAAASRTRCRCPWSVTRTTTSPAPALASTVTRPPRSEYLEALLSRLAKTCARRTGSPSSVDRRRRQRDGRPTAGASNIGRVVSSAASITSCRPTRSRRSSRRPRVIRETSSRSSSSRAMWRSLPIDHVGDRADRRRRRSPA